MPASIANRLLPLSLTASQAVEHASTSRTDGEIAALTRGLAAGNEEAFCDFHARYFNRLYQFLLVVARGQEDEAREALQQTFLRVLRYARVFESEETFWCWVKSLARSAARDAGRKQQRYSALLHNLTLLQANEPAHSGAREESALGALLEELLAGLAPPERVLLECKYVEGATIRELASEMGLSEKCVESRLARLRQELRQKLLKKMKSL